ncbi:hypothetical protein Tco_0725039 [Tanacetum coccineum]|uniref:Uncharacterized protein n=1 Tax=Tanacetum coccineum TaxID=301880 RepID=A0ABQ4YD92_9ASTR
MGESNKSRKKMEIEEIISYSDDLVNLLKNQSDINEFENCIEISNQLRSRCRSDHAQLNTSLQDEPKAILNAL